MNLIQMNVFREVMRHGSITAAAQALGRTQPAVSLMLKQLEDELGLRLFERRGRRLVPVPEADYLLAEADQILDRMAGLSRTMKVMSAGRSGSLRVAAMPGPSAHLFPRFLSEALKDLPEVEVSIASRSSLQIYEIASLQSIDFGFADLASEPDHNRHYTQMIISGRCFCALPRGHRLAERAEIGIADLNGELLGTLQHGHVLHSALRDAFQQAGVRFRTLIESQAFLPLLPFVANRQCIAIVDPLTVATEREIDAMRDQVVFRPLKAATRYHYAIVSPSHRPLSRLAGNLRDLWRDYLLAVLAKIDACPEVEDGRKPA
ncbi:LysR family transcriptional regulator [Paracoccus sp. MBLB3053]|uniref:LysR family transcriptional regulator n=1 Tax=Paracoccus aurantius TaxID=3073814 RepID=A0ABU2HUN5_9RHOB|nr:LysR family transcriptional regulator [Paracoccus sp. MBLB3053]MDS9468768.1 LysR family transcriptional regulator [Paracoccus sp. MBLB3053]